MRAQVTLQRLGEMKARREPIVVVTAYDYPSGRTAEQAEVDMVLVGDSGAQVVLGRATRGAAVESKRLFGRVARRWHEIEKVPQIRRDSGLHTAPGKNWDF
ncbi:3-methyl-2-oxobutanoate hydroxymethyltransferase [Microbacterium aurantiacum]|uniref:3-methyl-2-oxobutanoate hydroxymethyltransferase n=1 Tax=Microbacterium aurantiacum TaxID=162393 RepID=A0A0M8MME0_9MICO|nr:hypothetical protein A8L33_12925 [Microbacterium chocolatum]KOS09990.1 hypothetical protein XI38_13215 [Microbacterium chocolatum]